MKLLVELSEKDIQIKLDEMLGARVAEITDNYISKKVEEVIDTKLSRIDIDKLLSEEARKLFIKEYGAPGAYSSEYGKILRAEACELLAKRLKKSGLEL